MAWLESRHCIPAKLWLLCLPSDDEFLPALTAIPISVPSVIDQIGTGMGRLCFKSTEDVIGCLAGSRQKVPCWQPPFLRISYSLGTPSKLQRISYRFSTYKCHSCKAQADTFCSCDKLQAAVALDMLCSADDRCALYVSNQTTLPRCGQKVWCYAHSEEYA